MDQSPSWIHERMFAQMLGFDSSTDKGMSDFQTFIKTVERGGTGRRGRADWTPTPDPCNGLNIDLKNESIDNPLHLHKKWFGSYVRSDERASTVEPTINVVKQREIYYAFKLDADTTLSIQDQYRLIKYDTGQGNDGNKHSHSAIQ